MNPLLQSEEGYEDFVKTVEALLQESREDEKILTQALKRKEEEIAEKLELINCLKGVKTQESRKENPQENTQVNKEPDNSSWDNKYFAEIESKLASKLDEINEIKSHILFYSDKLTSLEEKATKIASLSDMTVEILKKHIEKLNEELRIREEIISELRLKEVDGRLTSKLSDKTKKPQAGQPTE